MRDDRPPLRLRQPLRIDAASWPIEPAALEALIGIGMTEGQIAQYYGVVWEDVRLLRARYAL